MMLTLFALLSCARADPVIVTVREDNTQIARSCRVEIAPDAIIADADGNGVIHVVADNVTVEIAPGSVLRGAKVGAGPGQTPWDALTGIGVRVDGRRNVTLKGLDVRGYKVGVYATLCEGLSVVDSSVCDIYRQRLRSTPQAEDAGDWLWPHANDQREWMTNYGGAVVAEACLGVDIRGVRVRHAQNGIILDRVNASTIRDNDCSFLSGWGLAMWRSSGNTVSRNAFDFCVRGHSEGIYNRGQDSAGILCFEQCKENVFVENSATHGGDGFFGFAGKEALGEAGNPVPGFDYTAAGCDDNVFIGNDFSYASAHGLELTFSNSCIVKGNRFVQNAICGIWGGYSNRWMIIGNTFAENGGAGYGLERGAINMEHAGGNVITDNTFVNNKVAAHFWWDDDAGLLKSPGVMSRYLGPTGNTFSNNRVRVDARHPFTTPRDKEPRLIGFQLRDAGSGNVSGNRYYANTVEIGVPNAVELDLPSGVALDQTGGSAPDAASRPRLAGQGVNHPVGARASLRGRASIIMDEWGPWDHERALVRFFGAGAFGHRYQVFGAKDVGAVITSPSGGALPTLTRWDGDGVVELDVSGAAGGVVPYVLDLNVDNAPVSRSGTLFAAAWSVRVFPWTADPREKPDEWRAEAERGARLTWTGPLDIPLAWGGPKGVAAWNASKDSLPGNSKYGLIAEAALDLPACTYVLTVLSDDGVRVTATPESGPDRTIIENWTWHGPTTDQGTFDHAGGPLNLRVEYFQLDGFAALRLDLHPRP